MFVFTFNVCFYIIFSRLFKVSKYSTIAFPPSSKYKQHSFLFMIKCPSPTNLNMYHPSFFDTKFGSPEPILQGFL